VFADRDNPAVFEEMNLALVEDSLTGRRSSRGKCVRDLWFKAVRQGHCAGVHRMLQAGIPVDIQNRSERTALAVAVNSNNETLVRYLLGAHANPRASNPFGFTPLQEAAMNGFAPIMRLLIEANADPGDLNAALPRAVYGGNLACVTLLLDLGVDVNRLDRFGMSVLTSAAVEGDDAMVRLLLARGADVRMSSPDGRNILHHAARESRIPLLLLLLEAGADPHQVDSRGDSPIMVATNWGRPNVAAILREFGTPTWTPERISRLVRKPPTGFTRSTSIPTWEKALFEEKNPSAIVACRDIFAKDRRVARLSRLGMMLIVWRVVAVYQRDQNRVRFLESLGVRSCFALAGASLPFGVVRALLNPFKVRIRPIYRGAHRLYGYRVERSTGNGTENWGEFRDIQPAFETALSVTDIDFMWM
jgi:hypothetical protein